MLQPICVLRTAFASVLLAFATFAALPSTSFAHDNVGAIRHVMMSTFDKPEAPLLVDPIAIAGSWAIAGWTQDGRGGRALLRQKDHAWSIHLCAGDALKDVEALKSMGLPADLATTLATELAAAEATADPARIALFSTFDGIVEMEADGSHPAHKHDASHGATEAHTN